MYSNYELEYTSSLSKLTPKIRDIPQLWLLFLFCVVIDSKKRKIWYFYAFHEKLLLQLKWAKGNLPFILPTALSSQSKGKNWVSIEMIIFHNK